MVSNFFKRSNFSVPLSVNVSQNQIVVNRTSNNDTIVTCTITGDRISYISWHRQGRPLNIPVTPTASVYQEVTTNGRTRTSVLHFQSVSHVFTPFSHWSVVNRVKLFGFGPN